ncbi:inositol monophosphatase family protein [Lactococcus garvieae]|nr:inositol monophosphatase family protein [Lactococcus garvieae]
MKDNTFALKKLEQAKVWIREAGIFLRDNIHQRLEISHKSSFSDLVTNFDKKVQEIIIENILKTYPEDKILAEESGKNLVSFDQSQENFWILDPIDGTINFVVQQDSFAVMLAYYEHGQAQFGLILNVMEDKLYWNNAHHVFCNNRKLTYKPKELSESLLAINSMIYRKNFYKLTDFSLKTLGVRMLGSAGIAYADLLEGKIVGYFSRLQPWDYAAGSILAGKLGFVTKTFEGEEPNLTDCQYIYSLPRHLVEQLIQETDVIL